MSYLVGYEDDSSNSSLDIKLISAVNESQAKHKVEDLINRGAYVNFKDAGGNTALHIAVNKSHLEVIEILLESGSDLTIKNNYGETPLALATKSKNLEVINAITYKKINVPGDNSCLFWAVALAYLTPVKYDDRELKQRFVKLFGAEESVKLTCVKEFIEEYNSSSNNCHDVTLGELIKVKFRNKVIDEISLNQRKFEESITISDFLDSKNEEYVIVGTLKERFCEAFSAELTSQNNIDINKLRPLDLNDTSIKDIEGELDKISNKKKVQKFKFDSYLECMRYPNAWGGNHEIQAMSQLLSIKIVVFSNGTKHSFGGSNATHLITLFNAGGVHYNFGLIRAQVLVEAIKSNNHEQVKTYLSLGIDNINFQDNSKLTALHFAAQHPNNSDIVQLLLNHGANPYMRNQNNHTPLEVARHIKMHNIIQLLKTQSSHESIGELVTKTDAQQNRPSLDCGEVFTGVKRTHAAEEVSVAKQQYSGKYYSKGGLVHSLHGNIYQLKLLMLFLKRGLDEKYSFRLSTEWDAADKFDDLVFEYLDKPNGGKVYRFLQAKHKQDESKKITANDLLTEKDGEFSFQKYFISYRRIKQSAEFSNPKDELKDFIICTNIDVDDILQNNFESVESADSILETGVQCKGKKPKRLKFKFDSFFDKSKLISILKNTSDVIRLAKKLAGHVVGSKKIELYDPLFKLYHCALTKEVINIQNKNFYDDFIEDRGLSAETKPFRKALDREVEKNGSSLINLKDIDLKLSGGFGKNAPQVSLPNDYVYDQEIKEFFEKLVLAVNQPNEIELGKIIKYQLGKEFNNIDTKHVYSRFLVKILNWMKEKTGRFVSHEDGKDLFEKIKKQVLGEVWFDVRDPVKSFTGRQDEVKYLHEALQVGSKQVIVHTAISGLGGIGKSELARKYAFEYGDKYDNVVWINAERYKTIVESFYRLARDNRVGIPTQDIDGKPKNVESIVHEVYRFFAKRNCLFIFDDAQKYRTTEDNDDGIDKFLPLKSVASKLYFIITSRNQKWKGLLVSLGTFSEAESVEFIKKSLAIINNFQDQQIKKLAETLQYFPLALQQAVAYIKEEDTNSKSLTKDRAFHVSDYLRKYEEESKELLNFSFPEDSTNLYTRTTLTTWRITLEKIKDKECGKNALEILNIMAYFANNSIPVKIFSDIMSEEKTELILLKQYSMINLDQGEATIHQLVQQVTRLELKDQNKEERIVKKAFKLLFDSYPHDFGKDNETKRQLLPHLEVFLSHIDDWLRNEPKDEQKTNIESNYIEDLLICMGDGYASLNPQRGKELYERLVEVQEKLYKPTHPHYIRIGRALVNLSNCYALLQDSLTQKKLLERALTIIGKFFDICSDEVAKTLANLAKAYGQLGDYKTAKTLSEHVVLFYEQLYGKDSCYTAEARTSLGIFCASLGDFQKLKEYCEQALPILQKHHGRDSKEVANALIHQGISYGYFGDNRKKLELLNEALPIVKKHYGHEDLAVAETLVALGDAHLGLGNPREAQQLFKTALKIREKFYGPNHFETVKTLINLGTVHGALREYEEQKHLANQALYIIKKYYDTNPIQVGNALGCLSNAYGGLKQYGEQIQVLKQVLSVFEKHFGLNHIVVARVQMNIGAAYASLEKYQVAKQWLETALQQMKKYYRNKNHVEVADLLQKLSVVYDALGDYSKVKNSLNEALPIIESCYGLESLEVAFALENLAAALSNLGKYHEAEKIIERASRIEIQRSGPNSIEIVNTLKILRQITASLGGEQST